MFDLNGAYDEAVAMTLRVVGVGHDNAVTEAIDRLELCRLAVKAGQLDVASESIAVAKRLIDQLAPAPDMERRLLLEQARPTALMARRSVPETCSWQRLTTGFILDR
ncbi:MAG: hypothetical protein R2706_14170 [Acidimicrobiales bacterium]